MIEDGVSARSSSDGSAAPASLATSNRMRCRTDASGGGGLDATRPVAAIADSTISGSSNSSAAIAGSEEGADEVMIATERELAEDAQWKRIQQNTFTRWANEHLKTVNKQIGNLETDLSDGLRLITLIELLSGKRFAKYNRKPSFRSQKLENISLALEFLQDVENIKIVNIDSAAIVDCKLKLILGLIWMLILHYSISMPIWDGEGEGENHVEKGPTPKQRLLNWIQSRIPDLPIMNFTNDWNDGKAVGALVDAVAPGLCPDWQDWKSQNALQNATEAMDLADDWLNVKQLIKPEELVSPNMDEQSMMTYLSQYPSAKLKDGAPLRPRTNASRVRVYGPGIEADGPKAKTPTSFTVETFSAGNGNVEVQIENPKGQLTPANIKNNNDGSKTYAVSYTPEIEGKHKISVHFAGIEVPRSPYSVNVKRASTSTPKVTAFGPGIQGDDITVGKATYFDIVAKDAGNLSPEVIIVDTAGNQNALPIKLFAVDNETWKCEYIPTAPGPYNINIFLSNQPIPSSPFGIQVLPASDAKSVKASGRGLQSQGVRVNDLANFKIYAEKAGDGIPEVQIIAPGGVLEHVSVEKIKNSNGIYDVNYQPKKPGRHVVMITFAGHEIPKSPFEVNVGPYKESKIKAYGPGLSTGIVGQPAVFTVESNGETGALGFSIEGTSQAKIECDDNGDGSANIKYYPTASGEYAVHILCDGEDIPNSPYIVQISPATDYYPDKVECSGKGIGKDPLIANVPASFQVNTKKAGRAPLNVQVLDAEYNPVPVNVKNNNDTHFCEYTPKGGKKHVVLVNYGGVAVPGSPFRINVAQQFRPNKVQLFGPGLESPVKADTPTHFTADCSQAGIGDLNIKLVSESGIEVPLQVTDNEDGVYLIDYSFPLSGTYTLTCSYGGVQIPQSPIKLKATSGVDVSKVKVDGLETSVCLNSKAEFVVDSRELGVQDDTNKVLCTIRNPSGDKTENIVTPLSDGTYKISYTPFEEGEHVIEILYDGLPIPGSPFVVNVKKGTDPSKCIAYGRGLEKGIVNEINSFTVETKGAGSGGLGLAIEGPSEAKMTCKDHRDGSCSVEYVPTEPGDYDISIKFAEQHIPGSPFKVEIDYDIDVKKVKVYGKGLEPNHCRSQVPCTFKIDASEVGKAPLDVSIQTDEGPLETKPEVYDNGDGTYDVVYSPVVEGSTLTAKILYNGQNVANSPFKLKVLPKTEPDKIKVIGPPLTNKGGVTASIPTEFTIDTSLAGVGDLDVQVLGPDKQPRKVKLTDTGDGIYKINFVPDDCGLYTIPVKYGGKPIPTSPLHLQCYATGTADKCAMPSVQDKVCKANDEQRLDVDVKHAGYGKITCRIKSISGSDVDVFVEDNHDGTFSIYYKIPEPGDYTLNVKFGGQPVPNGLCTFTVKTLEEYEEYIKYYSETSRAVEISEKKQLFRAVHLPNVPVPTGGGQLTAEVKMPSSNVDKPLIEDNKDGTVSLKYDPREEGLHELFVKYNGEHVQGSPFKFHVDSITSGYVTAYGPGLTHGVSGEPANFTISTKGAGSGGLSLAVEGPSKADISCHDNKDGTVSVSYLPTAPGEYKIMVKFGDKHIKGSPYATKVTGEGRKRNQISVGSCSEVSFPGQVNNNDIRLLNASIQAPSGLEEPCFLKNLPNGNLGISFTPREIGEHVVSVKKLGKHIVNSPFKITVGEREVGDAKKVKVSGAGLHEGKTHSENVFTVDTRNAGYGGLSLSIEGPSKAEIQCKDNEDGTLRISYKPTEPGYYIINLKFADHHVDGSPFTVKVTGEGSNRQREKIERQREAVPLTEVGSQCKLTFKMPGITPFDLSATVASPSTVIEDAEINEVEDGLYAVRFVPKELGVHTVSVRYKDIHIPGSPFQFTVGPLRDSGAHRVHAGGPGLERGEQGQPCEFNIWTREAGAGALAISVEGPSKAEIDFKDRKDGSCYVSYVVSEPGEYRVGIKFNEQHIPDSPYKLFISPAMGDAHKLEIAQFPVSGVQADTPAHFLVHKNGAKGELDGKIISPSGAEDDCFIQSIDPETYSVRFMPRENGIHNIHVKFNGVHIPGSPCRIKVGKEDADPAAVHAHGNGLGEVKTGHKTDFLVDTCNAGSGTLAVTIDGPSKVSMDCTEVEEGYKVRYTPLVPGDYYISLKYNGYHVVGSPFKVKCIGENLAERGAQETSSVVVETVQKVSKVKNTGPVLPNFKSDASKVTSKGLGLKKAYLQKQNQFTVSASSAGNNILYVGLYGPKGPCEEVFIKHTGRNNYNVTYTVKERGEYIIIVKWGDEHIPGSPFRVEA